MKTYIKIREDHQMSAYIEPNKVNSPPQHWTLLMVLDPGSTLATL